MLSFMFLKKEPAVLTQPSLLPSPASQIPLESNPGATTPGEPTEISTHKLIDPQRNVLQMSAFSQHGVTADSRLCEFPSKKRLRAENSSSVNSSVKRMKKVDDSSVADEQHQSFSDKLQAYLRKTSESENSILFEIDAAVETIDKKVSTGVLTTPGIPPYQAAKALSLALHQKMSLLAKKKKIIESDTLSKARETVLHYMQQFKAALSPEEKLFVTQDFIGRYSVEGNFPIHRCNTMMCPTCEIPMNIRNSDGFLICVQCNTTQVHTERFGVSGTSCSSDDADVQNTSAKRENNFREFLHLLQGKKPNMDFEEKMPSITRKLSRMVLAITGGDFKAQDRIVDSLCSMGLRKFGKFAVLIESRIRGIPMIRLPIQLENRMCAMFLIIVDPHERHKLPHRKHFLSYAYCAWQFCRIEKMPQFFCLFRLLKDQKKIAHQDQVFKNICAEVGWPFDSPLSPAFISSDD